MAVKNSTSYYNGSWQLPLTVMSVVLLIAGGQIMYQSRVDDEELQQLEALRQQTISQNSGNDTASGSGEKSGEIGIPEKNMLVPIWPVEKNKVVVTEPFSENHKKTSFAPSAKYKGQKLAVLATLPGEVVFVGADEAKGTYIVIEHNEQLFTTYEHLDPKTIVKQGDRVRAGEKLGSMGGTGLTAGSDKSPMMSFAVSSARNDGYLNPEDFLPRE